MQTKAEKAAYQRAWRLRNPDKALALTRANSRRRNLGLIKGRKPETLKAQRARYYIKHRDRLRAAQGGRKHGVSPEEYARRRTLPCEICGVHKVDERVGCGMHIDHDHQTEALRGTLCDRCNRGLGMFADSPERLAAAAAYVQRYSAPSLSIFRL